MADEDRTHGALTRMTRLAQREPEAVAWLEKMVADGLPESARAAVDVALETGEPMPQVLATVLRANPSARAAEIVARAVPIDSDRLRELAIAASEVLLADTDWPQAESADQRLLRRHGLEVALSRRLAGAGRLTEARAGAESAIAGLGRLSDDGGGGVRARLVDALDLLSTVLSEQGDRRGAVDAARRALELRRGLDDPYRPLADGQLRLGIALLAAERAEEALGTLTSASAGLRETLARGADPYRAIRGAVGQGDPSTPIRLPVAMGWEPSGFDALIVDLGPTTEHLLRHLEHALLALAYALAGDKPLSRAGSAALDELDAGRQARRRGGQFPRHEIELLETLVRRRLTPAQRDPDRAFALARDLERVAEEAAKGGDGDTALRARSAQETCLRHIGPAARDELISALGMHAQLLDNAGLAAESVAPAQEALTLAEEKGATGVEQALLLHNLARRLGSAGRAEDAMRASAKAVALFSAEFVGERALDPTVMAGMLVTLVRRAEAAGGEVHFNADIENAVVKLLRTAGLDPSIGLVRVMAAATGLFDSALRQQREDTAARIQQALAELATQRPDDRSVHVAAGLLASGLLWRRIRDGDVEGARALYAQVEAAVEAAPNVAALVVEHGKSATDMMAAYDEAGDHAAAAAVAAAALDSLRSPAYLEARVRDLGDDPDAFVAAVEAYAREAR